MKTNYTKEEFQIVESKFGIMPIERKMSDFKKQTGREIDNLTALKLLRIENMCSIRLRTDRYKALSNAGLYVSERPMRTGDGVGTCYKVMRNGAIRVRVSANWGGKFGNYADCVQI